MNARECNQGQNPSGAIIAAVSEELVARESNQEQNPGGAIITAVSMHGTISMPFGLPSNESLKSEKGCRLLVHQFIQFLLFQGCGWGESFPSASFLDKNN